MRVRGYARRFSLDESTVYKMIDRGEIKAIRIGTRFRTSSIASFRNSGIGQCLLELKLERRKGL
jgi:excisionase family DNA binding protein